MEEALALQQPPSPQLPSPKPLSSQPLLSDPLLPQPLSPEPISSDPLLPEPQPPSPHPPSPEPPSPEPLLPQPLSSEPIPSQPLVPEPISSPSSPSQPPSTKYPSPKPLSPEPIPSDPLLPQPLFPERKPSSPYPPSPEPILPEPIPSQPLSPQPILLQSSFSRPSKTLSSKTLLAQPLLPQSLLPQTFLPSSLSPKTTRPSNTKPKKKQSVDADYVPQTYDSDSQDEFFDIFDDAEDLADLAPQQHRTKRKFSSGPDQVLTPDAGSSAQNKKIKTSPSSSVIEYPIPDPDNSPPSDAVPPSSHSKNGIAKSKKKGKKGGIMGDEDYSFEMDDEDEREFVISTNEKGAVVFDYSRERAKRFAEVISSTGDIYSDREKSLFLQLAMRGFQPLFPKFWQYDFPTLPDSLFPAFEGSSKPLIQIEGSSAFYAIKSLNNLFLLGGRVRDCTILGKRPEAIIKQAIKKYIRWAIDDVNIDITSKSIPVHTIHTQRKGETTLEAVKHLNKRLSKLAIRHNTESSNPIEGKEGPLIPSSPTSNMIPLLIGFIICGPIVAVMTLDMDQPQRSRPYDMDGKFISQFDLSERGQDVWNCLAIAITVSHIRKTMGRMAEDGSGRYVKRDKNQLSAEDI